MKPNGEKKTFDGKAHLVEKSHYRVRTTSGKFRNAIFTAFILQTFKCTVDYSESDINKCKERNNIHSFHV